MAIFLNLIAKTMNAGGCAIVSAFDAGSAAFNCTMSALSPGERTKLGNRIKEQERKIQALTSGIAKETSKFADPAAALQSEAVKSLLNAVKELHKEIEPMKLRIAELDALKGVKKPQQESAGISTSIVNSISGLMPGEKAGLQKKIHANEKKIQLLYADFAREVAKQPDPYEAINSKAVAAINTKINELKAENDALKIQIADLAKPKEKPKAPEKKPQGDARKAQPDAKKPQPESAGVAKFFIQALTNSVSGYLPGEKSTIERKLAECDKKIQGLYLDVAKESAKYADAAEAVTAAPVVALVAKINELKAEVAALNQHKAELSGATGAGKAKAAAASAQAAAKAVKAAVAEEKTAEPSGSLESPVAVEAAAEADGAAAVTETEVAAVVEPVAQEESDPTEGTPYVNSRTKSSDIPAPTLLPPTEEDIKAAVRVIQAEEAKEEPVSEDVAPSSEEPPAVEEESAVAAEVSSETAVVDTDEAVNVQAASIVALVEHPPLIPVPEAEEVFRVHDAVVPAVAEETAEASASDSVTEETTVAEEAAASEEVVAEQHDAVETAAEPAAEASPGEVVETPPTIAAAEEPPPVATSARADSFGVAAEYAPSVPASRSESTIKEEAGSGFRTRLFRNQFSILTPAPVEAPAPVEPPAPDLEPPTREEIESVARGLQADDVEKYKISEILDEQAAVPEATSDAAENAEPEAVAAESGETAADETAGEETEDTDAEAEEAEGDETGADDADVQDYFKKLSERRNAALSGTKETSAASKKGSKKSK